MSQHKVKELFFKVSTVFPELETEGLISRTNLINTKYTMLLQPMKAPESELSNDPVSNNIVYKEALSLSKSSLISIVY